MRQIPLLVLISCASLQVSHRFDSSERRFRDGGIQVTPEALQVTADELTELGRHTVLQLGTLVAKVPANATEDQFRQWLRETAAELGGTHFIPYAEIQSMSLPDWMEAISIHDRDIHEGMTHYVVFQVRPSEWTSLPSALQPQARY